MNDVGVPIIRNQAPSPRELDPLDVMRDNMAFWHVNAERLWEQVSRMVVDVEDEDERRRAVQLMEDLSAARDKAQRCAVDLAPYVAPKIAAATFQPKADDVPAEAIPADPVEASIAYQRLIRGVR